MPDLCQLSDVKDWLTIPSEQVSDDVLLARLISATSADFLNEINRPDFAPSIKYMEFRQGNGLQEIFLNHYPINAIYSVQIDGQTVPESPDGISDGWYFDPAADPENRIKLRLLGFQFTNWRNWLQRAFPYWSSTRSGDLSRNNVVIEYSAGYGGTIEDGPFNVPAAGDAAESLFQISIGAFVSDAGVKYQESGDALALVTGAPNQGQYSVTVVGSTGIYTFNAADAGVTVLLSYAFADIPDDVTQAVIDWVSYRYKQRQWIGQSSRKSSAGDQTTFIDQAMPQSTSNAVAKYNRMVF